MPSRKDLRAIVAALDALEAAQMAHLRVVSRGLARDLRRHLDLGGHSRQSSDFELPVCWFAYPYFGCAKIPAWDRTCTHA